MTISLFSRQGFSAKHSITVFLLLFFRMIVCPEANGQAEQKFNLSVSYAEKKLTVFNRDVEVGAGEEKNSISLTEEEGEGLVWIDGLSFATGVINIDLKGKNVFQHSFVGIAFHAVDSLTFDAVYFRPFQFRSSDPIRKSHSIQYVSLPVYTWQKLRELQDGDVYENSIHPAPDPDDWFHARIEITGKELIVYVENDATPSLKVPLLGKVREGRIALYTADRSGGKFANLSVRKD
jgi:hypothetical protein